MDSITWRRKNHPGKSTLRRIKKEKMILLRQRFYREMAQRGYPPEEIQSVMAAGKNSRNRLVHQWHVEDRI